MPQATTFGRRGVAARALARPASRPTSRAPSPAQEAAPKAQGGSFAGYVVWLLFRFDGRLDRTTYRYCRVAANVTFLIILSSLNSAKPGSVVGVGMELLFSVLVFGTLAVMAWTTLAMQVKRRHDRDKSWPWLFVGFIPILGPLWVLVETCWLEGTPGYNRFDDVSKTAAAEFS
jgi:uncharacterized membrane protein YhaH (DUF805 family)